MNRSNLWLITCCCSMPWLALAANLHEITTYERTEDIDGDIFGYKARLDDDRLTEQWAINEKAVDKPDYEARLKTLYLAHEQNFDRELHALHDATVHDAQTRLQIGYLDKIRTLCVKQLAHLDDPRLRSYYAFKPETIDSQRSFDLVKDHLVPALAFVSDPDAVNEAPARLQSLSNHARDLYERLCEFYADSVHAAIERTDDPQILKELLVLAE